MKLRAHSREDGKIEICSPSVGYYRDLPKKGALVAPLEQAGALETLGHRRVLVMPAEAGGLVVETAARRRGAVAYDDVLFVLDPEVAGGAFVAEKKERTATGALVFLAPMAGRFYARPAPDKPPFVKAGDALKRGDVIGLLEVMKTFSRLTYGGEDLPAEALVLRVVPTDGSDIDGGSPILELAIPS